MVVSTVSGELSGLRLHRVLNTLTGQPYLTSRNDEVLINVFSRYICYSCVLCRAVPAQPVRVEA